MPSNTPNLALPYPIPADTVDVPRDVQALADKLDGITALASPAVVRLADTKLAAPAALIDFTAIPASYAHLMLAVTARTDQAVPASSLGLRFNGDTATNYDGTTLAGNGISASSSEYFGAGTMFGVIAVPGATSADGRLFGGGSILIPDYANTTAWKNTNGCAASASARTTGGHLVNLNSGLWCSVAAINQVTLLPGAGNFVAGSRATLYGLKGT